MMTRMPSRHSRLVVAMTVCTALVLGGCATATQGTAQQVALKVRSDQGAPVQGIHCDLSNKLGQWAVAAPGSVEVKRSAGPLMVKCESPEWVMAEQIKVDSDSKVATSVGKGAATGAGIGIVVGLLSPWMLFGTAAYTLSALIGGTAGSLYGGAAGGIVDASSGAAFEYAPEITVVVKARPVEPPSAVAEVR